MAGQPGKDWRGDQRATSASHADADDDEEGPTAEDGLPYPQGTNCHAREVSEGLLETQVEITLQESATEIYFSQPSLVVLVDTEEYWRLTNRNKQYDELAASKCLTEKYVANHSQTLNFPQKNKEISALPPAPVSAGVSVSPADIFDAFNTFAVPRVNELQHQWAKEAHSYTEKGLKMPGSLLDVNNISVQQNYPFHVSSATRKAASWGDVSDGGTTKDVTTASLHKGYTTLKTRRNDGPIAGGPSRESNRKLGLGEQKPFPLHMRSKGEERCVAQAKADVGSGIIAEEDDRDQEFDEDSDDRDTPDDEQLPKLNSSIAGFKELFDFDGRALTASMSVSTANWNPGNQDLLAVAYGTSPAARTGTSSDGHLVLWDLRKPNDQPVLQTHPVLSMQGCSRHSDAVWDVRWVDRGADKVPGEQLLSIGGDGKVYQWTMKKVLERTTMMSMKRVVNPRTKITWNTSGVDQANDAVVFMYASGLCIDISGQDASTYVIGTDEGLVHRCSTSYNEQYLDTYVGHTGPINRVAYNPFDSEVFSSCSDDGTIRLWNIKQPEAAVATLPPSTQYSAVTDFSWFAPNCPVLVVGDKEGCATVIKVQDEDIPRYSSFEQRERLQAVIDRQGKHWMAM
ncbi:axonemal inner arm I1 intermediate chain dynein IC138 [Neospora caninum Liverpool]|uniref:Dynein axonemal intermediate chain 4 n=1 Tax=Neospora caninum (strain Liverpool) TaxID=572307 RepID=F0VH17_NEOCL|nr:axonemal inner arm I1 intermediate chain dynein IC138 [Neospora caninum Liverpool]CBZ53011.1 axonemal inner arm I1 intermediate chain dynein IC138 [Neospora caninum Liverpool]|eukprot:XP_003883043.1 axonemal inner arm I1 intermediate chain dynein IC138 [Neospora caninum Liverpool]